MIIAFIFECLYHFQDYSFIKEINMFQLIKYNLLILCMSFSFVIACEQTQELLNDESKKIPEIKLIDLGLQESDQSEALSNK